MKRLLPASLSLILLFVLLSACRVETTVVIDVEPDGSGEVAVIVALDEEAVAAVENTESLSEQLRIADLLDAGWEASGPELSASDGITRITATKSFSVPERLPGVLNDIAGPEVFTNVSLVRQRSFARTSWDLTGQIDLSSGLALFSDPDLEAALSGLVLGRTEEEIREFAGCTTPECRSTDMFLFNLEVPLRDGGKGNGAIDSNVASWSFLLGETQSESFNLRWTVEDQAPRLWRIGSVIAAVLFILVVGLQIVRRRQGPQAGPSFPKPKKPIRRSREIIQESPGGVQEETSRSLELLVLGGVGVIWEGGNNPEGLLVSYVHDKGGIADTQEIADRYRSASLGHVSQEDFWSSLGVNGLVSEIEEEYLDRVIVRTDVIPFLDRMKEREFEVACLTNAVLPWALQLRQRFGLDEFISHWVISGEVGARKPSQAMFEALRRTSGVSFTNMLLIDSEVSTLEAAKGLGISTVLLKGSALIPEGFPHPVINSFAELFRPSDSQPDPKTESEILDPESE